MSNMDGQQVTPNIAIGGMRGIFNGLTPRGHIDPATQKYVPGKPKGLPMTIDFSERANAIGKLLFGEHAGLLEFVQSVFVDNNDNDAPLTISIGGGFQRLVIPANSQGEFPVYSPNPLEFEASVPAPVEGLIVKLTWKNVPGAFTPWGPITVGVINVNATFTPTPANFSDFSGNTGGADIVAIPANPNAKRRIVQNPGNNAEPLYLSFNSAASVASMTLLPGEKYDTEAGPIDQTAWHVFSASNIPFIAWEA